MKYSKYNKKSNTDKTNCSADCSATKTIFKFMNHKVGNSIKFSFLNIFFNPKFQDVI